MSGILMMAMAVSSACSKKNVPTDASDSESAQAEAPVPVPGVVIGGGTHGEKDVKKATAFKMNGDYADNVAVTMTGGRLSYYPDPTDLRESSKPINLGNGWWLNRQGISANSVFTKYTFEDYMKLKNVPRQSEIIKNIIPGARVTEFRQLPYPAYEAMSHLDEIKAIVGGW